ncbi:MAG: fumarylacetoacetate hydrolase family protein [Hyphomicrobiaceae bacterium]|nr:fumarylacetoacetate hydrolase family protein [Hyphomicrobiaceae bacterium]
MAKWLRFEQDGQVGFGTLENETIHIHSGDMFSGAERTGETAALADVKIVTPCDPSKMVCLWNNFRALTAKMEGEIPEEPLWFLKAPSSYSGTDEIIRRPQSYDGPVVYEGEIGIVIAKTCSRVSETDIGDYIFGYTCINDITAVKIISKDATFAQWTRSKSYDGFGVFGPVIATDVDPMALTIRTVLNGDERQNYPVNDMTFPPHKLTSLISHDVTLMPGDIIACGTSVGVGSMKEPENSVEITIDEIGTLSNTFLN